MAKRKPEHDARLGEPEPTFWSNPFSFTFFWWFGRVLLRGWKKPLEMSDLPRLHGSLYTERCHSAFVVAWQRRFQRLEPSAGGQKTLEACRNGKNWTVLFGVLMSSVFWLMFASILMHAVATATAFAFPQLLLQITNYLSTCDESQRTHAYIYAFLNFLFPFLGGLLLVHANRLAVLAQIRISASIISELFQKSMRMSIEAQQSIEKGKIINLMSADVENIIQFVHPALGGLVVLPLTIIAAIVQLYMQISWSTFVGVGVLVLATPMTAIFVNIMTNQREQMLMFTDKRIILVNQLLAGMKALKTYAWEAAQEARIREQRRREVGRLGAMIPYYTGTVGLMIASPIMAAVASFCVFARVTPAEEFTPGKIFASLSLFGLLKPALEGLPFVLVELGAAMVSLKRLTMFFTLKDRSDEHYEPFPGGGVGMAIKDGEFTYIKATGPIIEFDDEDDEDDEDAGAHGAKRSAAEEKDAKKGERGANGAAAVLSKKATLDAAPGSEIKGAAPRTARRLPGADGAADGGGGAEDGEDAEDGSMFALHGVNMSVAAGELVCVVGRVGSGKTSLVSALLGDMTKLGGTVLRTGSVAYVAQGAWIVNDTVRGNILFGKEFDQARYDEVVEACSLGHDFKILPAGDSTEIGEKGVNLSGGQKQRISVARAVYADADIYILDDPLSAVDVHVGAHIFKNVVQGILAKKARLLVTNQLQYAPEATSIVYLEDGVVAASGTYDQISHNERFADLLHEYEAGGAAEDNEEDEGPAEGDGGRERAEAMHASSRSGHRIIEGEWLRQRNEQQIMRNQSSLAGGLAGTRGLTDVGMLARSTTQVFRDVPTEQELFADEAGPTTPLIKRGTNLPEEDEGFGNTLRALFSAGPSSGLQRQRTQDRASGMALRGLLSQNNRGRDLLASSKSARSGGLSQLRSGGPSQLRSGGSSLRTPGLSQLPSAGGSQMRAGGGSQLRPLGASAGSGASEGRVLRRGPSARGAADRFIPLDVAKQEGSQALASPFEDPSLAEPATAGSQVPPEKSKHAVTFAEHATDPGKLAIVVGPSGKITKAVSKGGAEDPPLHDGSLMTDEERDEGKVNWGVYWRYIREGGLILVTLTVLCVWGGEAMSQLQQVWLQKWTGEHSDVQCDAAGNEIAPPPEAHAPTGLDMSYLPGYVGYAAGYIGASSLATMLLALAGLNASIRLHNKTLRAVVNAPMWFFDTTPAGRILNRFARDTADIDNSVPHEIFTLLEAATQLLALAVLISILEKFFLAGAIPMLGIYICIHMFYTRSYIELHRLDAIFRSPVYSHFGESLAGMDTIRAYGYERRFALENDRHVDFSHRALYALETADQWLALALDTIGALLSFLVSMLVVGRKGLLGASKSALILERTGELTQLLQLIVTAAATMENKFNAVERMLQFQRVPQEKQREIPDRKPPPEWPMQGVVEFRDVWMRYREGLPPVLKGVSFTVGSAEKVGIVGRTGSGKSSLIVALFRLSEPYQGAVFLDGINLLELGLQDVRGRIAAIPQEPILFSGTIRSNVDPYNEHEDHDIWTALERVDLKDVVGGQGEGLQSRVVESGENWSVGQRQLLCVARALLRKPQVLVLDEATASVDGETDAFIQRAIRANFGGSTILTIAHRLNTIMDSTKVLVMHDGQKLEYDSVPALLARPDSAFRAMVVGAGIHHEALGTITEEAETPKAGP